MATNLTIDPEFRDLLPRLSEERFNGLEESILSEGCRDPVVSWKGHGIIVDGHHRYEICQKHGIPFTTFERAFGDRDDVLIWMAGNQHNKRNEGEIDRVNTAMKVKPSLERKARANMESGGGDHKSGLANLPNPIPEPKINVRDELAKLAGTSSRNVAKIEKLLKMGAAELIDLAREKHVSIDAAFIVAKNLSKNEQIALVREGAKAVKAKAKSFAMPKKQKADNSSPSARTADESKSSITPSTASSTSGTENKETKAALENAKIFDHSLNLLREITGDVNTLCGNGKDEEPSLGGELLARHRQDLIVMLKNLRNLFTTYRPHAVCPYCQATAKKCDACKGTGWVAKDTFDNCPAVKDAKTNGSRRAA